MQLSDILQLLVFCWNSDCEDFQMSWMFRCRLMAFRVFRNGLITVHRFLDNQLFSKIIADVFSICHFVNTDLNAPEQQTAKTSAE